MAKEIITRKHESPGCPECGNHDLKLDVIVDVPLPWKNGEEARQWLDDRQSRLFKHVQYCNQRTHAAERGSSFKLLVDLDHEVAGEPVEVFRGPHECPNCSEEYESVFHIRPVWAKEWDVNCWVAAKGFARCKSCGWSRPPEAPH